MYGTINLHTTMHWHSMLTCRIMDVAGVSIVFFNNLKYDMFIYTDRPHNEHSYKDLFVILYLCISCWASNTNL